MSYDVSELIPRLRRAIGDTDDSNYEYADTILEEYITDAIYNILVRWEHDYRVEDGIIDSEPSELEKTMFIMQSKLDLLNRQPRLSFRSGSLSVTHRGDDTDALEAKLNKAVRRVKTVSGIGTSLTEFDDFARRLQDWLYITNIK